jgi:hypothetical protein
MTSEEIQRFDITQSELAESQEEIRGRTQDMDAATDAASEDTGFTPAQQQLLETIMRRAVQSAIQAIPSAVQSAIPSAVQSAIQAIPARQGPPGPPGPAGVGNGSGNGPKPPFMSEGNSA